MALLRTKMASLFNPTTRPSLYVYLSLRLLQFGAAAVTLSYFCSLIGWHNSHYCSKRFYHDQCAPFQQDYAKVPMLYLSFVATFCFMILAVIRLSCQHVSAFLDSTAASNSSTGSSESDGDSTADDSSNDISSFFTLCRRTLRSAPKSALLVDSTVLVVLSLCLNEYWTSIISPNHMHPGSGWTVPVCWLFERSRPTDAYYWKNLKVEKQRCMDNQISFYATIGVLAFTLMLVVVDAFYLRHDSSNKKVLDDDVPVEASEKQLLVDITA